MFRLVRHSYRLMPVATVLSFVLAVVTATLTVAIPVLLGQVVGGLPTAIGAGPSERFLALTVALLVALLLSNSLSQVGQAIWEPLNGAMEKDTALRIGAALSTDPDLRTLDDPAVAARVEKLRNRSWEIQMGARMIVSATPQSVLSLVGSTVALAIAFHWWVALIMLLVAAGAAERIRRTIVAQFDVWVGGTEPQKHADYAFKQAMGASAKEVRIFGLSGFLRRRYWENVTTAFTPYWKVRTRQSGMNVLVFGGRVAVTAGAAGLAGWEAGHGRLGLTALATALPLILAVGEVDIWSIAQIQRGHLALTWLEELAPPERLPTHARSRDPERVSVTEPDRPDAGRPSPPDIRRTPPRITFDDVGFRYPGSDRAILDGLDLELPAGTATALVGVNGAGKSTLVKLLAAGYLPTRGRIEIDGVDLARFDPNERAAWQRRIAPVTQDFTRLPLSAGDNVELGTGRPWAGRIDLTSWPDTTDLDEIAARAGIADLVTRLSDGWATPLDKTLPGGTDLSGGEWQRIGLARALRAVEGRAVDRVGGGGHGRHGADVLVLDEPAAALDVQSESRLVDGYLELARSVTSLVISHRFSVVRPVPRICVLEHGRIVEQGSHTELMEPGATPGRYRRMFSLQASRYVEAAQEVS